jgi:ABC-type uncharacterized transport system substrate-binding protein
MREISTDFVALKPDVIVASGTPAVGALKRATPSIPVVFVAVNEPVAQGFVASLAARGVTLLVSSRQTFPQSVNRWRCSRQWHRRSTASG